MVTVTAVRLLKCLLMACHAASNDAFVLSMLEVMCTDSLIFLSRSFSGSTCPYIVVHEDTIPLLRPRFVSWQAFDARTVRVFLDSESKARESDESQRRFDKLRQLMDLPETYRGEASISEEPGSARSITYADDKGFLLSTDCFSLRKQSPKADNRRLATWRIGPRAGMTMFSMSGLSAASDSDYGSGVSGTTSTIEALLLPMLVPCLRGCTERRAWKNKSALKLTLER